MLLVSGGVLVVYLWRYLGDTLRRLCVDTWVDTVWFSFCFLYNGNFINLIVMSLALRPAIGVAVRGCVCVWYLKIRRVAVRVAMCEIKKQTSWSTRNNKKNTPTPRINKGYAILWREKIRLAPHFLSFCGIFCVSEGGKWSFSRYEYLLIFFYEIFPIRSAIRLALFGVWTAHLLSNISLLAVT